MADHIYELPREMPTPPPPALQLGLVWLKYHTPPCAGGLEDQPMRLMRDIRDAVNTYEAINAYRNAQHMDAPGFQRWSSANAGIIKFMEYVFNLQDEEFGHAPGE